ncbi:hypothetical protein MKK55_16285 [Methylobacterium sp. J-059]|uniref:hypothetical protein n=1 Tax=Methylobacterium sp. J-059 TaxID=2836643 RepID=UPI001FB896C8|nr:hypothetical protein [Methylobacterium sp. J-059]MCJ2040491.1 hypothetical protein [Methylobacterium sp. J-059]
MIETVMVFALGFLVAMLCALLALPAVNARAARLARRRTEAQLPLSVGEIAAEKDFLRAEFAVRQRRMERAVEDARTKRQADMAALGNRTMEAAALARDVAARDAEIAEALALRGRLENELSTAQADGSSSLATLLALEEAHADLLDSLLAARNALGTVEDVPSGAAESEGSVREKLAATEAALAKAVSDRGEAVERENADLRRRITEVADTLTQRERLPPVAAYAMRASSH